MRKAVGAADGSAKAILRRLLGKAGVRSRRCLPSQVDHWLAKSVSRTAGHLTVDEWRGAGAVAAAACAVLLLGARGVTPEGFALRLWAGTWRAAAGAVLGFTGVLAWLHFVVVSRTTRLSRDLPFLADLLLLGLEGGLGLDCALDEAGRLLSGPLKEELAEVERVRLLGVPKVVALREMGARLAIAELAGFVNLLSQAETLGSGLTRAVTATATRFRTTRIMEAERLAGTAPVKMLFPLVFCLFPSILVLLLGPILIRRGGLLL
ncbi:MAG: type II secretion system F family protein [Chitinophagales bacterium]